MKKLSEMGHEMWVSPTWGTATVPCPLHDESKLNGCGYFPARFYTAEERRELVRAVWQAALEQAEIDFFSDPRLTKGCDEFIEEHEL